MTSHPSPWPVQEAKARFSELLETCLNEGPQVITKRGAEAAVIVSMDEWRRLSESSRPSLKDLLLADSPRFDIPVPPRKEWRFRPPPELS